MNRPPKHSHSATGAVADHRRLPGTLLGRARAVGNKEVRRCGAVHASLQVHLARFDLEQLAAADDPPEFAHRSSSAVVTAAAWHIVGESGSDAQPHSAALDPFAMSAIDDAAAITSDSSRAFLTADHNNTNIARRQPGQVIGRDAINPSADAQRNDRFELMSYLASTKRR